MKTKEEILNTLTALKPELAREYGVSYLALFGSYARGDQREDSDVDILVEVNPEIGLRFVELADFLENNLGIKVEIVSSRAVNKRHLDIIQEDLIDVA